MNVSESQVHITQVYIRIGSSLLHPHVASNLFFLLLSLRGMFTVLLNSISSKVRHRLNLLIYILTCLKWRHLGCIHQVLKVNQYISVENTFQLTCLE